MTIYITQIIGDKNGSVDADDRERAIAAAHAVCDKAGISPAEAAAAYREQWEALDDEAGMTGLALVWISARQAADVALTETWANPDAGLFCSIDA